MQERAQIFKFFYLKAFKVVRICKLSRIFPVQLIWAVGISCNDGKAKTALSGIVGNALQDSTDIDNIILEYL